MRSRTRSNGCTLLILSMAFLITFKPQINGYSFFPFFVYHLCMINELPHDSLLLDCQPQEENPMGWSEASDVYVENRRTRATIGPSWGTNHYVTAFKALKDASEFMDDKCGGRHCIWKFTEIGVYLYYIPSQEFKFMYPWSDHYLA
ncbi:hypothetical protein V2J09_003566 [Rumex salicifolius]